MTGHRVVVLDDSIPYGYGSRKPYGWPALLSDYTDTRLEVYELGVSGEKMVELPNRAVEESRARQADKERWKTTVLVHTGHNDVQGLSEPRTEPSMFEAIA